MLTPSKVQAIVDAAARIANDAKSLEKLRMQFKSHVDVANLPLTTEAMDLALPGFLVDGLIPGTNFTPEDVADVIWAMSSGTINYAATWTEVRGNLEKLCPPLTQ